MTTETEPSNFSELGLSDALLEAVASAGFEAPTPIQARTIPLLLQGKDIIGQAQTGTGKTAAFALPMLDQLDPRTRKVQGLILTPTRELALQVAEATHGFGKSLGKISVLPVYGGQPIHIQLQRLRRGVHVVVGTPGRILDHLHRGTLDLSHARMVVIDEADEMLRMGFIEDVEEILSQAPDPHQTALFSATMPPAIRRVADRHLTDPVRAKVDHEALTVPAIEQRYMKVPNQHKIEALTRLLETQTASAILVFSRTKLGCAEATERLQARGFAAEALHGDLSQWQRERVVEQLRSGKTQIVVATDVAARGLDVEHIDLVVNLDAPHDVESYVHRIGRTGRAGRKGMAVMFVTPRERRLLMQIERFIRQDIVRMEVPTQRDVYAKRVTAFKKQLTEVLTEEKIDVYRAIIEDLADEGGWELAEVAAAAARLARGDNPLVPPAEESQEPTQMDYDNRVLLVMAVGHRDGVRPGNIVGAMTNEGGINRRAIGAIDIRDDHSLVDVSGHAVAQVLERMSHTVIRRRPIKVQVARQGGHKRPRRR